MDRKTCRVEDKQKHRVKRFSSLCGVSIRVSSQQDRQEGCSYQRTGHWASPYTAQCLFKVCLFKKNKCSPIHVNPPVQHSQCQWDFLNQDVPQSVCHCAVYHMTTQVGTGCPASPRYRISTTFSQTLRQYLGSFLIAHLLCLGFTCVILLWSNIHSAIASLV